MCWLSGEIDLSAVSARWFEAYCRCKSRERIVVASIADLSRGFSGNVYRPLQWPASCETRNFQQGGEFNGIRWND
jgi:hypothetical protein